MLTVHVHPTSGEFITPTKNPEIGTIMVKSDPILEVRGGFVNTRVRTAFLRGPIATLESLVSAKKFQGTVIRLTSDSPFYEGQSPVANPTTGEVAMRNGVQYYQQFEVSLDINAVDREVANAPAQVEAPQTEETLA